MKKILVISLAALIISVPTPAYAATDSELQTSVQAGVQYIANNQASDGSITGLGGESDWSVVAIEASGQNVSEVTNNGVSLADFIANDSLNSSTPATTIERRIIAIEATGADSASYGGINYQDLLKGKYSDNQIGDNTLLNDDMFGIIAIAATNNDSINYIAQDSLDYLLSFQASDGGFSYTTDTCAWCGSDSNDTAAAIIAMHAGAKLNLTQSSAAKGSALIYLLSTQKTDGGFGYDVFSPSDGSSTAWGLMALNTIGDSVKAQALLARNWLLNNQNTDGGFSFGAYGFNDSDTYTTAHSITALMGSTWLLSPEPIVFPPATPANPISPINSEFNTASDNQADNKKTVVAAAPTTSPQGTNKNNKVPQLTAAGDISDFEREASPIKANISTTSIVQYSFITLLGLVAVAWFMLESRKAKGVN